MEELAVEEQRPTMSCIWKEILNYFQNLIQKWLTAQEATLHVLFLTVAQHLISVKMTCIDGLEAVVHKKECML